MIPLRIISWIIGFLFIQVLRAKYNCFFNASNGNLYNLTSLKKDGGWVVRDIGDDPDSKIQNYYKFNLCEDLTTNCTTLPKTGVYHEALYGNLSLGACTSYGSLDNAKIQVSKIKKNSAVNITYLQGESCTYIQNLSFESKPRTSTFLIYCGKDVNAAWTQTKYDDREITMCSPQFVIYHPAGCPINGGITVWRIIKYVFFGLIIAACLGALCSSCLENKTGRLSGWWTSLKTKMTGLFSKVKKSRKSRKNSPPPYEVKYETI